MADEDQYPPNPKQTDDFPATADQAPAGADWHAGPAAPDNPTAGSFNQAPSGAPKEALSDPAFPLTEPSPQPADHEPNLGDQPEGDDLF
jgi:hypothetical protein